MVAPKDQIVQIVVPSHKRADIVTVTELLPPETLILYVAESQAADYAKHNPGVRIETHPDSVLGLPRKRNLIYERWPNVMMIDDDAVVMDHFEHVVGEGRCWIQDPWEVYTLIQRLAQQARDLGVYLFGFSRYNDIRSFHSHRPFAMAGFVRGTPLGMLEGSGLTFNPRITAADDYWVSGMNAHIHRWCLVDLRYSIHSDGQAFIRRGGTSTYRNMSTEKRDNELLRQAFGDCIRLKTRKEFAHGFGNEGRSLIVPFS